MCCCPYALHPVMNKEVEMIMFVRNQSQELLEGIHEFMNDKGYSYYETDLCPHCVGEKYLDKNKTALSSDIYKLIKDFDTDDVALLKEHLSNAFFTMRATSILCQGLVELVESFEDDDD